MADSRGYYRLWGATMPQDWRMSSLSMASMGMLVAPGTRGECGSILAGLVGRSIAGPGYLVLGYAVSASAWKGHAMPLYDRAENTLDVLELDGIGRRPVAFICHSLGGLLIKQVLRTAHDAPNAAWQDIARHTRLIVFLSTPHSGASLASWMQYVSTLLRTTVSVEELEAHHPRLRELNNWYRDQHTALGLTTFVYYEKRPTVAGILVVDATTADPGIPGVRPIPLDEDHVSICKPASRQEQVYRRVQRLLEEMLTPLQGVTPPAAHPLGSPYYGREQTQHLPPPVERLAGPWRTILRYHHPNATVSSLDGNRRASGNGWKPARAWKS